jgi:NADPH2:quinone reductase
MFDLFEAGKLRAPIDGSLPLADFATAMRRVESRKVVGKIVLVPERRT